MAISSHTKPDPSITRLLKSIFQIFRIQFESRRKDQNHIVNQILNCQITCFNPHATLLPETLVTVRLLDRYLCLNIIMERAITRMASERPVVIFTKSSCGMSHTVRALFTDFGVHPAVHELDLNPRGREMEQALSRLGCSPTVPAVFIGGELVGGVSEVMSLHLNRSLIPLLKKVGALWV